MLSAGRRVACAEGMIEKGKHLERGGAYHPAASITICVPQPQSNAMPAFAENLFFGG